MVVVFEKPVNILFAENHLGKWEVEYSKWSINSKKKQIRIIRRNKSDGEMNKRFLIEIWLLFFMMREMWAYCTYNFNCIPNFFPTWCEISIQLYWVRVYHYCTRDLFDIYCCTFNACQIEVSICFHEQSFMEGMWVNAKLHAYFMR